MPLKNILPDLRTHIENAVRDTYMPFTQKILEGGQIPFLMAEEDIYESTLYGAMFQTDRHSGEIVGICLRDILKDNPYFFTSVVEHECVHADQALYLQSYSYLQYSIMHFYYLTCLMEIEAYGRCIFKNLQDAIKGTIAREQIFTKDYMKSREDIIILFNIENRFLKDEYKADIQELIDIFKSENYTKRFLDSVELCGQNTDVMTEDDVLFDIFYQLSAGDHCAEQAVSVMFADILYLHKWVTEKGLSLKDEIVGDKSRYDFFKKTFTAADDRAFLNRNDPDLFSKEQVDRIWRNIVDIDSKKEIRLTLARNKVSEILDSYFLNK